MKLKKLLFSLFALFTSTTAWGQEPATIGSINYNSTIGAYEINSADNLRDLSVYVNGNGMDEYSTGGKESTKHNCSGKTFKVTGYIDMSGVADYKPIGVSETDGCFCGTFDGQANTISNLNISGGLFGYNGGTIERIVLSNSSISGSGYVGGITSRNVNNGVVQNCRVESTVSIYASSGYGGNFGGIVGCNEGSTTKVLGCVSAATVSINGMPECNENGGIVGTNNGTVKDCLFLGDVVEAAYSYRRGAIVGNNSGSNARVQNCYFTNSSVAGGNAVNNNDGTGATVTNTGLAHTITLGEKVWLNPTSSATYSCANLIGYTFEGGYALDYGSTLYSTIGATIALRPDDYPGYTFNSFSYNDGSDHDIVGNSFTMPAANVSVSALWTENVLELVNDEDNSSALSTAFAGGKTYNRVILNGRSLTKNGNWNTLCLPFSMTAEEIATSPLAGAIIKEMDEESRYTLGDYTLTLKFKTASSIEAGKPYIVKWADGSGTVGNPLTFNLVTITSATPQTVTTNDEGKQLNFVGTYGPVGLTKNVTANLYMGSDSQLYYPNVDGFYVNAFRAYFKLGKLGGGVKAIVMDFGEDDPDAIRNSQFTIHNEEAEWYDLGGRKLSGKPTQHGIYIHNGRKEVLK